MSSGLASGLALAQSSQFPGADQPNQWDTKGNPSATPLISPTPARPLSQQTPAPAPAIAPNTAPPSQFPAANQPSQWDVKGNPAASPLITPNPTFPSQPIVSPGVPPTTVPPNHWSPNQPIPPGWGYYPWGGYTVLWNGTNRIVYWNGYQVPAFIPRPFGGVVYLYDPNLVPGANRPSAESQKPPPAPEPTAFEKGLLAFRAGRSADAAKIWKDVVQKDHEDVTTMRLLALALFENREVDNAAAMMRQAYRADPTLAGRELDSDLLNLTSSRRSVLVNRASEYANRIGSASGWLSVTVLMQADGRYELARKMLKRSADEGLEPDVRAALDAALASKVRAPAVKPANKPASPAAPTPASTPKTPTTAAPPSTAPTK
ncbi:MAG: tetratricopeptide repeat protein [Phycisphaerales bacterium]|nr:tetratricopeptide repeat protein [Phycisphaerales bacterium]